jgi:hypothetical protein
MLSMVSGSNGLWDEQMFKAFVRGHGYELVATVTYRDEWEKFPELLLIESKFVAQLHDELFSLVDAEELPYRSNGLQNATSYLEQCVVGYSTTAEQPYPSEEALKALSMGIWANWHQL